VDARHALNAHQEPITMNKSFIAVAAALLLAATAPAQAISFEGAITQGGTTVADYASTGLVSFDIDFRSVDAASLEYRIDADDLSMPLAWNAILRNFTELGIEGYSVTLSRGGFTLVGSVTRQFGGSSTATADGGSALISFSTPEFLDVEIGNALGTTPAATDWTLGGLAAGDRLTLTVTPVPEPGTWGLMAAGLGLVGWLARRRAP
jgi:PEP-CTERM motif